MPKNKVRIEVPSDLDMSRDDFAAWQSLSDHPLLDGELIEDITLSTTTKYTVVPHGLGRAYRGFIDVRGIGLVEDQSNNRKDREIRLYRESAPVLIDYVGTTAATSTVTFSNLRGDTDIEYILEAYIENNSGNAQDYFIRLNGSSADYDTVELFANGSSVTTSTASTGLWIHGSNNDGWSTTTLFAQSGQQRFSVTQNTRNANGHYRAFSGNWSNTTDEVTALAIYNASSEIGAGSKFWLYARENRATKAAIWIF